MQYLNYYYYYYNFYSSKLIWEISPQDLDEYTLYPPMSQITWLQANFCWKPVFELKVS